jgi:hypothetical protein
MLPITGSIVHQHHLAVGDQARDGSETEHLNGDAGRLPFPQESDEEGMPRGVDDADRAVAARESPENGARQFGPDDESVREIRWDAEFGVSQSMSNRARNPVVTAGSCVTTRKSQVLSKHLRVKFSEAINAGPSSATMYFAWYLAWAPA